MVTFNSPLLNLNGPLSNTFKLLQVSFHAVQYKPQLRVSCGLGMLNDYIQAADDCMCTMYGYSKAIMWSQGDLIHLGWIHLVGYNLHICVTRSCVLIQGDFMEDLIMSLDQIYSHIHHFHWRRHQNSHSVFTNLPQRHKEPSRNISYTYGNYCRQFNNLTRLSLYYIG